jgi:hypothetical protein
MTPITNPRNFQVVPAPYAEGEMLAEHLIFLSLCSEAISGISFETRASFISACLCFSGHDGAGHGESARRALYTAEQHLVGGNGGP